MADTPATGNGKRLTVTLGNVLVIMAMLGSTIVTTAFTYGAIVSRITALEVKVDGLTEWVRNISHHQPGDAP